VKLQRTPENRYSIKKKKGRTNRETENLFQQMKTRKNREEKQKKNRVGELSEEKANLALNNLEEKFHELIYFQHAPIKKNSAKDYHAIDHILTFIYPEHDRVEFQIKNSEAGVREHKKWYPNIPVIVSHVSKQEVEQGVFLNIEETEKEILDKLFKEYFIRNFSQQEYNEFLKEAYKE